MPEGVARGKSLSLKARALRYLSLRDHSRSELERKLSAYATPEDDLPKLLDSLAQEGWQSEARFAASLVHRRAARYGVRRITAELDRHGVSESDRLEALSELGRSEADRAWQAWSRRFEGPASTPQELARQQRFLLQRGFGADTIRGVLRRARRSEQR